MFGERRGDPSGRSDLRLRHQALLCAPCVACAPCTFPHPFGLTRGQDVFVERLADRNRNSQNDQRNAAGKDYATRCVSRNNFQKRSRYS